MPLVDKATLVAQLAPPLDLDLTRALVEEFISLERRFIQTVKERESNAQ